MTINLLPYNFFQAGRGLNNSNSPGGKSLTEIINEVINQVNANSVSIGDSGDLIPAVQDLTALKAIDTTSEEDYPDKLLINVEDNGLYRLDRDSSDAEDSPHIIEPTTGVGRWFRMSKELFSTNWTRTGVIIDTKVAGDNVRFGDDAYLYLGDSNIGSIRYNATGTSIDIASSEGLTLKDQFLSAGISISETGITGLSGFTATSIVGALNELKTELGAESLWDRSGAVLSPQNAGDSIRLDDSAYMNLGGSDVGKLRYNPTGTVVEIVSTANLSLKDQYLSAGLQLSETGVTGLSGFTATSIVGALNELKSELGAESLWDRSGTDVSFQNGGDDLLLADDEKINFGTDKDAFIRYTPTGVGYLEIGNNTSGATIWIQDNTSIWLENGGLDGWGIDTSGNVYMYTTRVAGSFSEIGVYDSLIDINDIQNDTDVAIRGVSKTALYYNAGDDEFTISSAQIIQDDINLYFGNDKDFKLYFNSASNQCGFEKQVITSGGFVFGNITAQKYFALDFGSNTILMQMGASAYVSLSDTVFNANIGTRGFVIDNTTGYLDMGDGTSAIRVETSIITLNIGANDVDVRISGDTDPYLIYTDAVNEKVGIGLNNPAEKLEVNGNVKATNFIPASKTEVADPVAFDNTDNEIGGLTISATYSQVEVQALRDKTEELADDCRTLRGKVADLIDALQSYGLV